MTETEKKTLSAAKLLSMLCNLLILVLTVISVRSFFTVGGEGNMTGMGSYCFRYFTVDSNILAAVVSLVLLISELTALRSASELPKWAATLKAVGAVAVGVTFFTVVLFLGPMAGYGAMFAGANLYMHLITPLLSMLSFVLFERKPLLKLRTTLLCVLPTLVYGVVYFYQVLIVGPWKGGWFDFYGFNMGGMWYVSAAVMLVATWLLALALRAIRQAGKK